MNKSETAVKDINAMTRAEFEALPCRGWDEEIEFTELVILPTRRKHDSGYRLLDFVACRKGVAVCRLSGCSDVIHVDGIGGFGDNWLKRYGTVPRLVPPAGWSIDCLAASGLLRMWPSSHKMKCGPALSSFEIFAIEKEPAARPRGEG